jgi:sialate O-acetylesterase
MKLRSILPVVLVALFVNAIAFAQLQLPSLITDHMVLQRDIPAHLWGWSAPGATVTVNFAGQTKATTADGFGRWSVHLDPLTASDQPRDLTVSDSKNTLTVHDVLVGEVWLCSGQSNMEFSMWNANNSPQELAQSGHPQIRLFGLSSHLIAPQPNDDVPAVWQHCDSQSAGPFSAVGYYFARRIHPWA